VSHQSNARKENRAARRTLTRAGVALLDRVSIEGDALAKAVTSGADLVDLISYHVSEALTRLDAQGGDVLGRTVVTIGEHPDFPGAVTIEAKVASMKSIKLDADEDPDFDNDPDSRSGF
jgi:hypothetical protein